MTQEQKLLIDALAVAVTGTMRPLDTQVDAQAFLRLAQSHNVTALVCDGLEKAGVPAPAGIEGALQNAYMRAIYKDAQLDYTQSQLQEALGDIPHIFLKGAVLKHDYPVPALRTMSDLDVLCYAKDFAAIDQVAKQLEATTLEGDGNHRNYCFPGGTILEFHPNLLHHATPIAAELNPGWQYAQQTGSGWQLTEEGFYLNTLCHIAKHFVDGGVGVRFLLDIWVSRHLRKQQPDRSFVEAELTRFGLLDFAQKLEALADAWFGSEPMTELLEELGQYILTSGSHGTTDRAILNSLSLSPGGSRTSALMKKAFYPRAELEDRFPWCKGRPLLLPAAWCARAFKAVTTHGDLIAKWSRDSGKVDKAEIAAHRQKLHRFGIPKK